jgi:hypothetical protein
MTDESDTVGAPHPRALLQLDYKWLAVFVVFCAFQGFTYNDAFFFGTKSQWVFFLSVEDSVLTAILAAPTSLFALVVFSYGASALRGPHAAKIMPLRLKLFWLLMVFAIMSIMLLPVEERPLPRNLHEWAIVILGILLVLGVLPLVVFGVLFIVSAIFDEPDLRVFAVVVSGLFVLLLGTAVTARVDRTLAENRSDTIFDLLDQSSVRGKLVRPLSAGFILAKGDDWLWLPRSQVKKITAVPD